MRFTIEQYDKAIKALEAAKTQLDPDGDECHSCGDSGHQAWECEHNPLLAMAICEGIAKASEEKLSMRSCEGTSDTVPPSQALQAFAALSFSASSLPVRRR